MQKKPPKSQSVTEYFVTSISKFGSNSLRRIFFFFWAHVFGGFFAKYEDERFLSVFVWALGRSWKRLQNGTKINKIREIFITKMHDIRFDWTLKITEVYSFEKWIMVAVPVYHLLSCPIYCSPLRKINMYIHEHKDASKSYISN